MSIVAQNLLKGYNLSMKNYSSARAGRGKTAYRTPSLWHHRQKQKVDKIKIKNSSKLAVIFYGKDK